MTTSHSTNLRRSKSPEPNTSGYLSARRDDVTERLASLRPSKELIEYYRKKIEDLTSDHDKLLGHLNNYRTTFEEQSKKQEALRLREEEISELQRALSDMQVYLFQEREQVLRLYAENDRLKIRELEDRRKIQQLLQLSGVTESEITYFIKEPPSKSIVKQHVVPVSSSRKQTNSSARVSANNNAKCSSESVNGVEHEAVLRECEKLSNQVEALQQQLTDQTTLAREEVAALLEDRRVRLEESDAKKEKDQLEIRSLMERLRKTQELLYESSRDFLEQRLHYRKSEKEWLVERDKMVRQVEAVTAKTDIATQDARNALLSSPSWQAISGASNLPSEREQRYQRHITRMEEQLQQQQELSEMYREQLIQMEDDVSRMREEGDVSKVIFRDRTEKISKRLALMNKRYADLERRRHFEVKGFQTDIQTLREKLRKVERQLFKVTLSLSEEPHPEGSRPEDVDLAVLKSVHATATNSKKLSNELRNLKAMMYGLENEFRHL